MGKKDTPPPPPPTPKWCPTCGVEISKNETLCSECRR